MIEARNGEGNGTPLRYACLENPMNRGAWWAAVHGVAKSRTWLGDFTFTFHFHALEKEMAAHSSVLAWRIPGTGEVGCHLWGRTRLKWLSSSSSRSQKHIWFYIHEILEKAKLLVVSRYLRWRGQEGKGTDCKGAQRKFLEQWECTWQWSHPVHICKNSSNVHIRSVKFNACKLYYKF